MFQLVNKPGIDSSSSALLGVGLHARYAFKQKSRNLSRVSMPEFWAHPTCQQPHASPVFGELVFFPCAVRLPDQLTLIPTPIRFFLVYEGLLQALYPLLHNIANTADDQRRPSQFASLFGQFKGLSADLWPPFCLKCRPDASIYSNHYPFIELVRVFKVSIAPQLILVTACPGLESSEEFIAALSMTRAKSYRIHRYWFPRQLWQKPLHLTSPTHRRSHIHHHHQWPVAFPRLGVSQLNAIARLSVKPYCMDIAKKSPPHQNMVRVRGAPAIRMMESGVMRPISVRDHAIVIVRQVKQQERHSIIESTGREVTNRHVSVRREVRFKVAHYERDAPGRGVVEDGQEEFINPIIHLVSAWMGGLGKTTGPKR